MTEDGSQLPPFTAIQGRVIFGMLALLLIAFNFRTQIADFFRPTPVEISLADLERQFDADTPAALARWRGKPMILRATIAAGQGDSVALESINPMAVHARLNQRLDGHDDEPITLHCRDIEEGGVLGGKPQLLNCDIVRVGAPI